jgi:heme A synthase
MRAEYEKWKAQYPTDELACWSAWKEIQILQPRVAELQTRLTEANIAWAEQVDRVAELETGIAALVPFMEIAFEAEGDTFGVQHNNATDALSAAECLLRSR